MESQKTHNLSQAMKVNSSQEMQVDSSQEPKVNSFQEMAAERARKEKETLDQEPPYSIFSRRQRRLLIVIASLAALFSPLTANIYYPALNTLSDDLHESLSKINLTITTYLIFQGLAPSFIGNLADETGRRPSYIICFTIYIGANIGLALLQDYPTLLVLRMVQSSGSSGTVALANALVSDVVTSADRGSAIGYAQMGATVGPAFGPIIGGLLTQFQGWRSIFWFLTAFSGLVFLFILVVLPETCRKVVGNGSIPPPWWNLSLLSYLQLRKQRQHGTAPSRDTVNDKKSKARPNPLRSIYILLQKESGILIFYAGTLFAGLYMVLSSMPALFATKYHFNTLQVGLCYIPTGLGSMTASYVVGRLLNWNFRRHARQLGMEIIDRKQQDLTHFPIEAARLEVVSPLVYLAAAGVIAYGWVMHAHTSLAGPVILLYLSTFCMSGSFTGLSTLVVDLNRESSGTATAAMNMSRCWLGAGGVALVNPLLNAVGIGWVAVIVAAVWLLISPVVWLIIKRGPRWREELRVKEGEKKKRREAARQAASGNEEG